MADASIIIPLAKIGKLHILKKLFKKIHITQGVKKELTELKRPGASEIENAMKTWIIKTKEKISFEESQNLAEKENISFEDAELILTALSKKETILTNDYRIHLVAKTKQVKTQWLVSLLLYCVKKKILTKTQAKENLFELVQNGVRLKTEVYALTEKKIDEI